MKGSNFEINEANLPRDARLEALARALEADNAARTAGTERVQRRLQAWQRKYRTEHNELLGARTAARLREYAEQHRRPEPGQRRERQLVTSDQLLEEKRRQHNDSLRFMREMRVEREGLDRLFAAAHRELDEIIRPGARRARQSEARIVDQGFTYRPLDLLFKKENPLPPPPPPPPGFAPEYPGWWDRAWLSDLTGSSKQVRLDGYLWPSVGQSGSCVWVQNWSSSDHDWMHSYRENGYLVPFLVPSNGVLQVEFDVQCSFSEHCIESWDEFGWSHYSAWTQERAVLSVFWNWEDVTPATETRDDYFVWGLDANGGGGSSSGVVHAVPAGQIRTLTMRTNMAFPAGVTVWVYVGTEQIVFAQTNDVSVNLFTNSAWFITGIRVRMD